LPLAASRYVARLSGRREILVKLALGLVQRAIRIQPENRCAQNPCYLCHQQHSWCLESVKIRAHDAIYGAGAYTVPCRACVRAHSCACAACICICSMFVTEEAHQLAMLGDLSRAATRFRDASKLDQDNLLALYGGIRCKVGLHTHALVLACLVCMGALPFRSTHEPPCGLNRRQTYRTHTH
jgi:hypothetical protein